MQTTKHAHSRAQQRCIPPFVDRLLNEFGEEEHVGCGCVRLFFSHRSIRNMERSFFGLLKANVLTQGMEDARAKMWKLTLAKERNSALIAALVYGTPRADDITMNDRQHERLAANVRELEQEAAVRGVAAHRVHTVAEAAEKIIQLA